MVLTNLSGLSFLVYKIILCFMRFFFPTLTLCFELNTNIIKLLSGKKPRDISVQKAKFAML